MFQRAIISVALQIKTLAVAPAGIVCPTGFVGSMERQASHKALARIQATKIVCHFATKANLTASPK